MTDLIPVGLNKNKRTFKPNIHKKKRNRPTTTTPSPPPSPQHTHSSDPDSPPTYTEHESTDDTTENERRVKRRRRRRRNEPTRTEATPEPDNEEEEEENRLTHLLRERECDLKSPMYTELKQMYQHLLDSTRAKTVVPPWKEVQHDELVTAFDRRMELLRVSPMKKGTYVARKNKRWTDLETQVFYDGLKEFGMKFSMIADTIPGRTEREVHEKYLKEERTYPHKVSEYLIL
ncbi:uncharacterized protein EV154DRAFT_523629 [Mucor mucedo]|uniref:uncharacterized protein n=1 Tax=Mucor mucedo TaxID=29922 RepID=UPI00221F0F8B|nr:uncharacterized protein EV154DRAFT_523629 [Mucor mucedo]KAI7881233.1 hypothetical protein EV154DRAFT_523629 [Mucor mucedo]